MSVIIYQDHIEILEEENLLLREEVLFLRKQLEYKSLGNLDTMESYERTDD
tara:strand:+ start:84 stop:236 length:153 start_codon:yes stop_codon:yes gene_type:complete